MKTSQIALKFGPKSLKYQPKKPCEVFLFSILISSNGLQRNKYQ